MKYIINIYKQVNSLIAKLNKQFIKNGNICCYEKKK